MEGPEGEGVARREADWGAYQRGLDASYDGVVFAGFFVPMGPRGGLTHGGSARSAETLFLETFGRAVAEHRLNSSGLSIPGVPLPMRTVDYGPPDGFAEAHDYDSFSALARRWAQGRLGVIWGTLREDGRIDRFEVAVDPNLYHDGPFVEWGLERIRRLIEAYDAPYRGVVRHVAKALAAIWCHGHCHTLNVLGRWREAIPVVTDSQRLLREALGELDEDGGAGAAEAARAQRKAIMPAFLRQEAASHLHGGQRVRALERLLEGLKLDPLFPFGSRERFREYYNNRYAFTLATWYDDFDEFLAERYGGQGPSFERDLAARYTERGLTELVPVDIELFVDWIGRAASEGVAVADKVGAWFSELRSRHPDEPFVLLYWGEALRKIKIVKHGEIMANPDARLWDPVADKFKRAYALDPTLAVAAVRAAGVLHPTLGPLLGTPEGESRASEVRDLQLEKGRPFFEQFAPWTLEGGRGTEDDLAAWVERSGQGPGAGEGASGR